MDKQNIQLPQLKFKLKESKTSVIIKLNQRFN